MQRQWFSIILITVVGIGVVVGFGRDLGGSTSSSTMKNIQTSKQETIIF